MAIYKVTGYAIDKKSKRIIGKVRTESIDTRNNSLFKNAKNIADVYNIYDSFWNKLNSNPSKTVVIVGIRKY